MNYEKILSKKEALEWLDRKFRAVAWQDWDDPNNEDQAKDYASICIAMEALDKQIPRQIKIIRGEDCCPTCGYDYGPETTRKRLIHWDVPYCKKCGQRFGYPG